MFKKENRITKDSDFQKLYSEGRSCFQGELKVIIFSNKTQVKRLGVVVSKKISKKATVRNLLKRRCRSVLRKKINDIPPGTDVLVVCYPRAEQLNIKELEEKIIKALNRLTSKK